MKGSNMATTGDRECHAKGGVISLEECLQQWQRFDLPGPRPHPCVFFDQTEIDEILRLSAIEGTRQCEERRKVLEAAEVLMNRDLRISRRGWVGESRWACLNCGTREVEIRRDQPDQGKCLRCGTINDDIAFKSWWAVEMHGRNLHQIRLLTWAHVFTGDATFADKALHLMMSYAEWLPDCPVDDKERRRFSVDPQLDMRFGIQMAYAYDLLYNHRGWTDRMRTSFEENVLLSTAKLNVERWPDFQLHNMYNTGCILMAAVGASLGRPEDVERGVGPAYGLLRSLTEGLDDDGFWPESSLNYHLAVVRDMASLTEIMFHVGFDFYKVDRYRKMYQSPIRLAEPTSGIIPGWGDSGNFSPLLFDMMQPAFEIYYHRTGDQVMGAYLKLAAEHGRRAFASLFVTEHWKQLPVEDSVPASTLLDTQGLAALRAGGGARSKYVRLNYLRKIGGHNHEDRLNLILHADGTFVGAKTSGTDYSYPTYRWHRHALGHNLVTIGRKTSDRFGPGELAFHAGFEPVQVISAKADKSYPGYQQQRTVVLVGDRYVVDLFRVAGEEETDIDWVWHCAGELGRPPGGAATGLEGDEIYGFLEDAVKITTDDPWEATWALDRPDTGVRLAEVRNPYDDVIDWSLSTEDSLVRVKPNGQRVRLYNNCAAHPVYPSPIMSPVFSSYYNYGSEFPVDAPHDTEASPSRPGQRRNFRLKGAVSPGTDVYYARGVGYGWEVPGRMWMLLVRRRARAAHFMVAMDTFRDAPYVKSVKTLLDEPAASALRTTTADGENVFISCYDDQPIEADGVSLSGRFGAMSCRGNQLAWALVVDGRRLRSCGWQIESQQRDTFIVTRDANGGIQGRTSRGEAIPVRVTKGP